MKAREDSTIICRAYAEAMLAARDKGLTGTRATTAIMSTAAKVASRILGHDISTRDVEQAIRN